MKKYLFLLIILISSCTCQEKRDEVQSDVKADHPQTMATLFNYYAAEYRALAYQAFNIARQRVDLLRDEFPADTGLAIVVDIDETLLDNSPHQALMILSDSNYPYMWNEWCALAEALPVPGSVEFLQYADEAGFQIYYISNRKDKYVREGTIENLSALGFPQIEEDRILLRKQPSDAHPFPSNKQSRRDMVAANGHRIVLMIGDNLGDFYVDKHDHAARQQQLDSLRTAWGSRFIILPNAMYGNWPSSLNINSRSSMDSLLRHMARVFDER